MLLKILCIKHLSYLQIVTKYLTDAKVGGRKSPSPAQFRTVELFVEKATLQRRVSCLILYCEDDYLNY